MLIDDARCFLGPLPNMRPGDWPTLPEIVDMLRAGADRYVTILDDVIIAVPPALREVVDQWWLATVTSREGRDGSSQKLWEAYNPKPSVAMRRLVKSLMPARARQLYQRVR